MPSVWDVLWQNSDAGSWSPSFAREADDLRQRGDLANAREVAERGVAVDPLVPEGHAVLGRICWELGDAGRARAAWETTLRLDPHQRGALKGLAYLACQRGDQASALRFADAARVVDGRDADHDEVLALIQSHFAGWSPEGRVDAQTAPRGVRVVADLPLPRTDGGEETMTVLVVDDAGLVVRTLAAPTSQARSVETTGAVLSALGAEATRVTSGLGLGAWREVIVEGDSGAIALGLATAGLTVMVSGDAHSPLGSVRFALTRGCAGLRRAEHTP